MRIFGSRPVGRVALPGPAARSTFELPAASSSHTRMSQLPDDGTGRPSRRSIPAAPTAPVVHAAVPEAGQIDQRAPAIGATCPGGVCQRRLKLLALRRGCPSRLSPTGASGGWLSTVIVRDAAVAFPAVSSATTPSL